MIVRDLCVGYGKKMVIEGLNTSVSAGEVVALVGPNGCGKTTLLRTLAGIYAPTSGTIIINEKKLSDIDPSELGRIVGYVPQQFFYIPYTTVMETVLIGRTPYMSQKPTDEDLQIVNDVMERMNILDLAERNVNELSGGQRQRVFIARAFSQTPNFLVFDEPTNTLDLRHQLSTMRLMREAAHKEGKGVIVALHDLSLALRYSDRTVMMTDGKIYGDGPTETTITERSVSDVYGVDVKITEDGEGRHIHLVDRSGTF